MIPAKWASWKNFERWLDQECQRKRGNEQSAKLKRWESESEGRSSALGPSKQRLCLQANFTTRPGKLLVVLLLAEFWVLEIYLCLLRSTWHLILQPKAEVEPDPYEKLFEPTIYSSLNFRGRPSWLADSPSPAPRSNPTQPPPSPISDQSPSLAQRSSRMLSHVPLSRFLRLKALIGSSFGKRVNTPQYIYPSDAGVIGRAPLVSLLNTLDPVTCGDHGDMSSSLELWFSHKKIPSTNRISSWEDTDFFHSNHLLVFFSRIRSGIKDWLEDMVKAAKISVSYQGDHISGDGTR